MAWWVVCGCPHRCTAQHKDQSCETKVSQYIACNIKLLHNGKRETKAPLLYTISCFIHSSLYLFYLHLFVCSRQLDSKQSTSFNNLTVCSTLQIIAIEKQVHSKYIINLIKYPHVRKRTHLFLNWALHAFFAHVLETCLTCLLLNVGGRGLI